LQRPVNCSAGLQTGCNVDLLVHVESQTIQISDHTDIGWSHRSIQTGVKPEREYPQCADKFLVQVLKGRGFSCATSGSHSMRALAPEGIFAVKKEMNQRFPKATAPQLARAVGAAVISPPLPPQETIFVSRGGNGGKRTAKMPLESRRDSASNLCRGLISRGK